LVLAPLRCWIKKQSNDAENVLCMTVLDQLKRATEVALAPTATAPWYAWNAEKNVTKPGSTIWVTT